jgi:ABC-type sulfate/molybdate transport systems ATPase subunit
MRTSALGRGSGAEEFSPSQAEALLTRVGLGGYAARDVTNLSGGKAQRVSLARALANSPNVLLLDEPTSALNEDAKAEVESLIRDIIRETHLTCIVVTHDTAQAARLATRVMTLQGGSVRSMLPFINLSFSL